MRLTTTIIIWIIFYQLQKCHGSRVEVNVEDKSGSKVKLICVPPNSTSSGKANHKGNILWEGFKFGPNERRKVVLNAPSHISVPNMNLNAINLKCLLEALTSIKKVGTKLQDDGESRQQREMADGTANVLKSGKSKEERSRDERELAGTIQTETGNCPPGQRIDQDRCFPCFPGSYTSGQETECFLCPKDFFMSKEGADACWPCPNGKKTRKEGADSEDACIDPFVGVYGKWGFSYKWIIFIILLAILLLCTWIIIIFLVIRLCYGRRSRVSTARKDEETGLRISIQTPPRQEQEQKNKQSKGKKHICKRHKRQLFSRKQLMFDVDIKGSAILTDKNSSSSEGEDICFTENSNEVELEATETTKEDTIQKQVETSADVSSNVPGTLKFTKNVAIEFVVEPDAQKNTVENNSRDFDRKCGENRQVSNVDSDKKMDNVERTRDDENETTVKESEKFGDGNSDKESYESVQYSESSGKTLEDGRSSNDLSPTEDSSHEAAKKTSQITESIVKDSDSSIKQISVTNIQAYQNQPTHFEKQLQQTGKNFRSNEDLFSSRKDDSTKWHWGNSRDHPTREKSDIHATMESAFEKLNKPHQNQISNNVSHPNEGVLFKKANHTEPTSCPTHQDSSLHCHVDVVLLPLPSSSQARYF